MKHLACIAMVAWLMGGAAAQPLLDVEKAACFSTNLSRKQFNVAPVTLDTVLSDLARKHSEEMLASGYFSHHSPNEMCRTLRDRLKHGNRFCLSSAENLYKCEGAARSELADGAVDSWMRSPSHRQKLMNARFNRVGIGLAGQGGTYLFTQVFSYEPVIVQSLDVVLGPGGYRVLITGLVTDGPRVGGLFVDGKRQASWEAGADDTFTAELCLTKAGVLEIGQLVGTREWVIETEIPIPPPGIPVRVQGWMPGFFASSLWDMFRAAF